MFSSELASKSVASIHSEVREAKDGRGDAVSQNEFPGFTSKQILRFQLYGALIVADVFAVIVSFCLASFARFGNAIDPAALRILYAAIPLYLVLSAKGGAYSAEVLLRPIRGALKASRALGLTAILLLVFGFTTRDTDEFSRAVFICGFLIAVAFVGFARWGLGCLIERNGRSSLRNELVIVDDVPYLARRGEIVLIADAISYEGSSEPFQLHRIGNLLKDCERVIVACKPERRDRWAGLLKCFDVDFELLAPELDDIGALGFRSYNGKTSVLLSHGPLKLQDRIMKRSLDLLVASAAVLFLIPLLLVVAAAIRIESRGPVLFRQDRVGYHNRIFAVLKFRSMYFDQCDTVGSVSTSRSDVRVTRVGRWIRSLSIDELPQLFNVLRGEMSIVGPRPHALSSTAEDYLFWQLDTRYAHRHVVKPGLTGLAQVRGFRGATHGARDLTDRLQADLEYLSGWTIWRDISIMLKTAKVLVHDKAY